ncbi:uncharacterized protein LOC127837264 [Dreissena polymorpha]|uniref:B box-type domain-containing protein n=1 Tax=Dreissena polymorpha TaxID=45954 RepID=A0A9D4JCD0_DREPO|nr:uncharacterized protein LOC127837264 [Dreissena polymorpha]KAH3802747.1 hypothetical protein DPMN_156428 [Dreissena polymorpha]
MSVKQYLCGPCLEEKGEIEGVVYCKECEEPLCGNCKHDHARIKALKLHKLCDLSDVPPQEIQELLKRLIACPNHETERVVHLCKDHDVTCCNTCALAEHRKCETLKVLADIKVDCTGLKTILHDLQQQGESLLEHERTHEELVSEIENKAMSSLQTIKQKLLDIYAQFENEVLSSIADKKKVIGEKIKTNNEKARQFLNAIEQQSTYIEQVEKFGTNEHVVLLQRQLEKNSVCRLKSTVGELDKRRSKSSFKCVEDTSFDRLLLEVKNSLRIEDCTCDVSETGSDTDNSQYKPYTKRILQLQCTKDLSTIPLFDKEKRPDARSCIWIDKNIVIALHEVNALLVIEEDSNFVLSKFICDVTPWSVSKTGPTDMVISLPCASKIAFAQLRYGNVHVITELKTRIPYHDVTRHASLNQYICMSNNRGQIDILNNNGTLLREINISSEIKEFVPSPVSLCNFNAHNRVLIISNWLKETLTALNLNGEKVFEYKHQDLLGAQQIAVDPCGNVYVTSYLLSILQISPSGHYIRTLPLEKKTDYPFGICFNNTFDKIALSGGGNDLDPYLGVYTFT